MKSIQGMAMRLVGVLTVLGFTAACGDDVPVKKATATISPSTEKKLDTNFKVTKQQPTEMRIGTQDWF